MPPEANETRRAAWVAATLVLVAGMAHIAFGFTAITGTETLQENVEEIESNPNFGKLYFSLATWGLIMLAVGVAEVASSAAFWRRTPNWRLASLLAAYAGLTAAFFTLAIFRASALITVVLLLVAIWLYSYHSKD